MAVQLHLFEEQGHAVVRFELRRSAASFEGASVIGLDLSPAEARALGQSLLDRAESANFWIQGMERNCKKMPFPWSLLQNGRVMRVAHIVGGAIGLKLLFLPPDGGFYWLGLGVLVLFANVIGYASHAKRSAASHSEGGQD